MKKLVLLSVLVACAPTAVTDFPEIEGWSPETAVSSYDAVTLWEAINGAADTFLQYGFQGLETAESSRDGSLVAGSEQFTREAFLGLRELEHCVSAEYVGGRTVFAVLPSPGSDVDATWQELSSKWDAIDADGGAPVLAKKVPYTGLVGVTRMGDAIVGIVGAEDEAALLDSLSQVR